MGGRHPPCRAEVPSNFSAAVAPMLVGGLGAGLTVTVSFTSQRPSQTELSMGWVDPWVGLGWVGSRFFRFWWIGLG